MTFHIFKAFPNKEIKNCLSYYLIIFKKQSSRMNDVFYLLKNTLDSFVCAMSSKHGWKPYIITQEMRLLNRI